jgi:DNA topoisomerase I
MMDDPDREPWSILAEKITEALPEGLSQAMKGKLEAVSAEPLPTYADDIARADPPEPKEPELGSPPAPAPPEEFG